MEEPIQIEYLPLVDNPLFIAGFDGWGNALDISRGMVDYLIRKLDGKVFASINPDLFYRFDENRPIVDIENGLLKKILPPGGFFYIVPKDRAGRDLILFKATEPSLRWFKFVDAFLGLCQKLDIKTMVTLGGMYDNVLHTDTTISALACNEEALSSLKGKKVLTINYKGPGAIHSTIHAAALKRGFRCISLWCHCPYYLQGTTHFGLLSALGLLLAWWGGFHLDTSELDVTWRELDRQIQDIIDKNPELQKMIHELKKAKAKGVLDPARRHDKVIHLEDFLKTK